VRSSDRGYAAVVTAGTLDSHRHDRLGGPGRVHEIAPRSAGAMRLEGLELLPGPNLPCRVAVTVDMYGARAETVDDSARRSATVATVLVADGDIEWI
jgi:hypothetical protein